MRPCLRAYQALPEEVPSSETFQVLPEAFQVLPEAYCCRSYCYNMHLDPGQQAPSCTSLPSEAYQALPEAYQVLPSSEAYQALPEAYQVLLLEAYWHNSYLAPGQEVQPCTGRCY